MEPKIKLPKFNFENPSIKTIDITFHSVNVVGGTRRLRATWVPELAQDLNAYHNIDAEAELTTLLSEQVAREIDTNIIRRLWGDTMTEDYNFGIEQVPSNRIGFEPTQTLRQHRLIEEEVSSGWGNVIMPAMRGVFAQTIASDLVAVQPMELPHLDLNYLTYLDPIHHQLEEPTVYDDGSYSIDHTFNGTIGIYTDLKPKPFIKKGRIFRGRP